MRLLTAQRTREAVLRCDKALTPDQRLAVEAGDAQLFESAHQATAGASTVTDVRESTRRMRVRMMSVEAINVQVGNFLLIYFCCCCCCCCCLSDYVVGECIEKIVKRQE
jgi:hypothetical protein